LPRRPFSIFSRKGKGKDAIGGRKRKKEGGDPFFFFLGGERKGNLPSTSRLEKKKGEHLSLSLTLGKKREPYGKRGKKEGKGDPRPISSSFIHFSSEEGRRKKKKENPTALAERTGKPEEKKKGKEGTASSPPLLCPGEGEKVSTLRASDQRRREGKRLEVRLFLLEGKGEGPLVREELLGEGRICGSTHMLF